MTEQVEGAQYHLKSWSSERAPCGRRLADFTDPAGNEFWTENARKVNCSRCITTAEYRRALVEQGAKLPPPVGMSLPAVQARRAGADMLHIYETLTRVNPRLSHVDAWHLAGNLYAGGYKLTGPD